MSQVIEIPRPVKLVSFSSHPWETWINCISVWLDDLRFISTDVLIFSFPFSFSLPFFSF